MSRRALVILGIGQCVNWGVLYYAFAVLLLPIQEALGVSRWVVTGAFSLALLVSAGSAPFMGRWADRGYGGTLIQVGGFTGAGLLVAWAMAPNLITLYVVWALLGLCMAATLYEPAFALVGRAHSDPRERLRALAAITVFGGLASTIFLPATAWLVVRLEWRTAVVILAAAVALSTCATRVVTLTTKMPAASPLPVPVRATDPQGLARIPHFGLVLMVFSLGSLGSAALTSNIVPALGERAVSPGVAATLGGLLGVMQIPGRALLMHGAIATSPSRLVVLSLLLQAIGLIVLALSPSAAFMAAGIGVFAIGSGLTTLARPHFVQTVFGTARAGLLNGRLASAQQLARAAGPIVAVSMAAAWSYSTLFAVLGGCFALLSIAWMSNARQSG